MDTTNRQLSKSSTQCCLPGGHGSCDRFSSTNVFGASAVLNFDGSEVSLYGGTGPTHGLFKVQIDDQPALTLNGSAVADHAQTLLVSRLIKHKCMT